MKKCARTLKREQKNWDRISTMRKARHKRILISLGIL